MEEEILFITWVYLEFIVQDTDLNEETQDHMQFFKLLLSVLLSLYQRTNLPTVVHVYIICKALIDCYFH